MNRNPFFEHILSYLAILAMSALLILGLFISFWPFNPIDVDYVRLLSDEIVSPGTVEYEISLTKNIDIPGRLIRDLVVAGEDGVQHVYHISDMVGSLAPGRNVLVSRVDIPSGVVNGVGHIRLVAIYNYPLGRPITETFRTKDVPVVSRRGCK